MAHRFEWTAWEQILAGRRNAALFGDGSRFAARFQGIQECGDHDRRHRATAPHPEGTVRTGTSGRSRPSGACSLERGAWRLKSARRRRERLPVTAICTRTLRPILQRLQTRDAPHQSHEITARQIKPEIRAAFQQPAIRRIALTRCQSVSSRGNSVNGRPFTRFSARASITQQITDRDA